MARKATDLLDVFRFSSEGSGSGRKPPSKRRRGSGGKDAGGGGRKKSAGRRFEGIFLNRRQLLLASSALVLLLMLSFTLGLATGRPGERDATKALARASDFLAIRARLPVVDPTTSRAVRPAAIEKRLMQDYRIKADNIRIRRDGSELVIEIGPFHSEAQAKRYLERSELDLAQIHMESPFRYAEFVPWRRR